MARRVPLAVQLARVHETQPDTPRFGNAALIRGFGVKRIAVAYHALLVARVVRRAGFVTLKGKKFPAFTSINGHAERGERERDEIDDAFFT